MKARYNPWVYIALGKERIWLVVAAVHEYELSVSGNAVEKSLSENLPVRLLYSVMIEYCCTRSSIWCILYGCYENYIIV